MKNQHKNMKDHRIGSHETAKRMLRILRDDGTHTEIYQSVSGTDPETMKEPGAEPKTMKEPGTEPETMKKLGTEPETMKKPGTEPETMKEPAGENRFFHRLSVFTEK